MESVFQGLLLIDWMEAILPMEFISLISLQHQGITK